MNGSFTYKLACAAALASLFISSCAPLYPEKRSNYISTTSMSPTIETTPYRLNTPTPTQTPTLTPTPTQTPTLTPTPTPRPINPRRGEIDTIAEFLWKEKIPPVSIQNVDVTCNWSGFPTEFHGPAYIHGITTEGKVIVTSDDGNAGLCDPNDIKNIQVSTLPKIENYNQIIAQWPGFIGEKLYNSPEPREITYGGVVIAEKDKEGNVFFGLRAPGNEKPLRMGYYVWGESEIWFIDYMIRKHGVEKFFPQNIHYQLLKIKNDSSDGIWSNSEMGIYQIVKAAIFGQKPPKVTVFVPEGYDDLKVVATGRLYNFDTYGGPIIHKLGSVVFTLDYLRNMGVEIKTIKDYNIKDYDMIDGIVVLVIDALTYRFEPNKIYNFPYTIEEIINSLPTGSVFIPPKQSCLSLISSPRNDIAIYLGGFLKNRDDIFDEIKYLSNLDHKHITRSYYPYVHILLDPFLPIEAYNETCAGVPCIRLDSIFSNDDSIRYEVYGKNIRFNIIYYGLYPSFYGWKGFVPDFLTTEIDIRSKQKNPNYEEWGF